MGNPFGSKSQTSSGTSSGSSTTTLSPQVQAAYNSLLGQIGNISDTSTPNSTITQANNGLSTLASSTNPNFAAASNTLGSAATPAYQNVNAYLSPFIQSALQAQIASQNEQNGEQQQGVIGNAIAKGALGGNRVSVAQGELQRQNDIANNAANSSLLNTGYQEALQGALSGQQGQTAAGTAQAGLGASENQSTLGSLAALLSSGQYSQSAPYTNLGSLAGSASALSNSGATVSSNGTTSQTTPAGNIFSQILGTGLEAASLFMRDGGRVGFASGGTPGFGDMATALAAALQASTPQQASNDNTSTANDNSPMQLSAGEKAGAQNIKSWLFPGNTGSREVGGQAVYAKGGMVKRFADGGFADGPYALLDGAADMGDTPSIGQLAPDLSAVPAVADRARQIRSALAQQAPALGLGSPAPAARASAAPLTVQTNNPGAITDGPWARGLPGYAGSHGDFAVFDSPASGSAAQLRLLNNYVNGGQNTISSIINKWAPAAANAPGSTANYINYVAQKTGIDPTRPVSADELPLIARAQSEWESGLKSGAPFTPPTGGNAAAPASLGDMAMPNSSNVIPFPQSASGAPGGGIPGGLGVTPPGGYGVPDSNAGYATSIGDVLKSLMAGKGLNLSPDARQALASAGFGMMAGTSPNGFTNIGTGGQAGIDQWMKKQELNRENALANSQIGAQQGELGIQGGQLGLNAATTGANVALTNVDTAKNRFVPSPIGMLRYDPANPASPPTVIPYNQLVDNGASSAPAAAPETDEHGFVVGSPPATNVNPLLMNPETAKLVTDQSQRALGGAQGDATNAQALNAQIGELANLAKSLPENGFLSQGSGFNQRVDAVKGINSVLQTMSIAPIDPGSVATAEGMKKLATQLQFSVADAVKTDPAAATIAQAAQASPSGENSQQGFNRIIGNIEALNKRSVDRYAFLQDWANKHYGDTSGADYAFNKFNPPDKYIKYGQQLTDQFNAPQAGSAGNPITPKSQADIDNAPSGTVFIVNGQKMVKK